MPAPLVDLNLGGLAKPATVLIERVSDFVGGAFAPYQMKRMVEAKANADIIAAGAEEQVLGLKERSQHRREAEALRQQANIENVLSKALPQLNEESDPSQIDDDWLAHFFEKSRNISDDDMQNLWAKVLSGEANEAGKYSKRTVSFLSDMSKKEADHFSCLCQFSAVCGGAGIAFVFNKEDGVYRENGLTFHVLSDVEAIGLVGCEYSLGVHLKLNGRGESVVFEYHGESIAVSVDKVIDIAGGTLKVGCVKLTQMGSELFSVCSVEPVDGFVDYVKDKWKDLLIEE